MAAVLAGGVVAMVIAGSLAWKWELGVKRVLLFTAVMAAMTGVVVYIVARTAAFLVGAVVVASIPLAAGVGILAFMFYRNPDRSSPADEGVVLSPADGRVIYVRDAHGGEIPTSEKGGRSYPLETLTKTPLTWQDSIVIGIAMSFLDVHVNRAPIAGTVSTLTHCAGRFSSLKRPEAIFENERTTLVIEGERTQLAIVQIASRLVRQIVTYVREGDHVAIGERIGMIRFGSQVDVVLPRDDCAVSVAVGDRVTAGVSVLARLRDAAS